MCPKSRSHHSLALWSGVAATTALVSGALLAACGNNAPPIITNSATSTNPSAIGELTGELNQLRSSPGWQAAGCDAAYEGTVRQIAMALDAHAPETAQSAIKLRQSKVQGSSGSLTLIDLGSSFLVHNGNPPTPKGQGWVSQSMSWHTVFDQFHALKKKDASSDEAWVQLDSAARSMLRLDETRLLTSANMNLQPSDQAGLQSLLQSYEDCLSDSSCTEPSLDSDASNELNGNPTYITLGRQLRQAPDTATKRQKIQQTVQVLARDAEPFRARPDAKAVTRISPTQIQIALDPGNLITTQAGLDNAAAAIQNIWSSSSLSVSVAWTQQQQQQQQSSNGQSAFRLVLDPSPDDAPTTRYADRTILIGIGRSDRSLAFAIGHVLGFGTHSYVDYSPYQCSYNVITNDTDFMSVSSTGSITSEEWNDLDRLYPSGGTTATVSASN